MVFDTETTGLKPQNGDRPIEFACQILNVHNGNLELELDDDFYINPGFLISDVITDLTGITNEKLQAEGVSPEDAHVAMANLFADVDVIAGYNVNFDVRMVSALYNDFGDSFPDIEALKAYVQEHPLQERTILIKGSNGIHMPKVVEVL